MIGLELGISKDSTDVIRMPFVHSRLLIQTISGVDTVELSLLLASLYHKLEQPDNSSSRSYFLNEVL